MIVLLVAAQCFVWVCAKLGARLLDLHVLLYRFDLVANPSPLLQAGGWLCVEPWKRLGRISLRDLAE